MNSIYLGIEFGSTRIKALAIDESMNVQSKGDFTWKSELNSANWTYELEQAWCGLRSVLKSIEHREDIRAVGISGMMHGYLAFDKDWQLLTPFRTWQNTTAAEAAEFLSGYLDFNIPQRWSIAHLYQAMLNNEDHLLKLAHITTLSGYIHYMLTGENVVGVGDVSGMFPLDPISQSYDEVMLEKFQHLVDERELPWKIRDLLPEIRMAGDAAGVLTTKGAALLDGALTVGLPFCPPEGDAGTGMTASNAVAPGSGNVSGGTSIFAMVVLKKALSRSYPEVDIVSTPDGKPVAMVHCNNCTKDMNDWISLLRQSLCLFGCEVDDNELYTRLYQISLDGNADAGGVIINNYITGESIVNIQGGVPMVLREARAELTLPNFMRAQLYSALVTLSIGMKMLADDGVEMKSITAHGGLFKTVGVAQKYLASACRVPVVCMHSAGEGGPYGMALLARYLMRDDKAESLEQFLKERVFQDAKAEVETPDETIAAGFDRYRHRFRKILPVEQLAVSVMV